MNKGTENDNRKITKDNVTKAAGLFILMLTGLILSLVCGDTIIIYGGIFAKRALNGLFAVLSAGSAVWLGSRLFAYRRLMVNELFEEEKAAEEMVRRDEENAPVLRAKGDLDPVKVKASFGKESSVWISQLSKIYGKNASIPDMEKAFGAILKDMEHMDDYQRRLGALIDANGAEALRDTEDVLDSAEQHIIRNIRKLINTMIALNPENQADVKTVYETAGLCNEDNKKILDKTKEFILAVTAFLNSQGDAGEGVSEVETYKEALKSQVQNGGIY